MPPNRNAPQKARNTNAPKKTRNEKARERAMQYLKEQPHYNDLMDYSKEAHNAARAAYLLEQAQAQALGKRAGKSKRRKTKRHKTRNKN